MPNWTDDDGFSWFFKDSCQRCSRIFDIEKDEIPEHNCIGGRYKSTSSNGMYRIPTYVGPLIKENCDVTSYGNAKLDYIAQAERKKLLEELRKDPISFFQKNFTVEQLKQFKTMLKKCKF